ncbi:MAG TPA: FkbM family methyltransferase [Acidimicrobiia bacterium]|nr:FkbM family methyltransferase [Acidimicrobiia bacterium]
MTPDHSVSAASEVASVLARLLEEPIVVADVGCRWGFADTWEQLGDRCHAIGFEPDEAECEQLRRRYRDRPWVEIVAHALGAEAGPATLHITREPACSSLYEPMDEVVDRHPRLEVQRLAERQQIDLVTLDDWCERRGVDRIDLIKLDTQGSELDVLRGAARTLDRVVAVQTEVEFNRMYEAQPLFGELDRFLRDRGFMLWQLENLSHHRQRGARSGLRQRNQLYDFDVAGFTRRSGQLFWADALFVRADVARPEPGTPWPEALRHACLTAALELDDLAGITLDLHHRELDGDAREVVEEARALLPEPDQETEWVTAVVGLDAREGPPRAELGTEGVLDEDLFVELGDPIDGAGWREPHRFGSTLGRWTGPGDHAWIDVPLRVPPGTRVEWTIAAVRERDPHGAIGVEVNGVPLELERAARDGGFVVTGTVPSGYQSDRRFTRVSLRTPEPVPLHRTPDPRKISLAVTELRLRAPDSGDPR